MDDSLRSTLSDRRKRWIHASVALRIVHSEMKKQKLLMPSCQPDEISEESINDDDRDEYEDMTKQMSFDSRSPFNSIEITGPSSSFSCCSEEASANIRIGPPGTISQCESIHSNVYISLNSSKVVDGAYSDKSLIRVQF